MVARIFKTRQKQLEYNATEREMDLQMLSRLLGKTVFQVTDNNLFYCSQSDIDLTTQQPQSGSMVLHIERVADGVIVTEGEWGAIAQSIQRVVDRELYDLHFNLKTSPTITSNCPYLMTESDLLRAKDRVCITTGRELDNYHVHRICISESWSNCPLYEKVTQ